MDPVTGAIIGGVGAFAKGLASYKSAQKQMKFQREMSNTAYQRQMADLRAAGINPMLAAKLGGASTPGGASYSIPNIGEAAVQGYSGAATAQQTQALTEKTQQETAKLKYEIENIMPEQVSKIHAEVRQINSQATLNNTQNNIAELNEKILALDSDAYRLLTQQLGFPVGQQTAKNILGMAGEMTKIANALGKSVGWVFDNLPSAIKQLKNVKRWIKK